MHFVGDGTYAFLSMFDRQHALKSADFFGIYSWLFPEMHHKRRAASLWNLSWADGTGRLKLSVDAEISRILHYYQGEDRERDFFDLQCTLGLNDINAMYGCNDFIEIFWECEPESKNTPFTDPPPVPTGVPDPSASSSHRKRPSQPPSEEGGSPPSSVASGGSQHCGMFCRMGLGEDCGEWDQYQCGGCLACVGDPFEFPPSPWIPSCFIDPMVKAESLPLLPEGDWAPAPSPHRQRPLRRHRGSGAPAAAARPPRPPPIPQPPAQDAQGPVPPLGEKGGGP